MASEFTSKHNQRNPRITFSGFLIPYKQEISLIWIGNQLDPVTHIPPDFYYQLLNNS